MASSLYSPSFYLWADPRRGGGDIGLVEGRHLSSTEVLTDRQQTGYSCWVPEAWQHWLWKKPSRQDTAETNESQIKRGRVAIVKVIKTAFHPTSRNSIYGEVQLSKIKSCRLRYSEGTLLGSPDSLRYKTIGSASELFLLHCIIYIYGMKARLCHFLQGVLGSR